MDDLISRQAAIDALDEIRHALWEIDIPSPTVPEYVEHHEQVQSVWKLLDKKQKELYVLQSVQPEPCEDAGEKTCRTCHLWEDGEINIACPWGSNYEHYEDDYCSLWEKQN